ncbi:MAG: hypothetical protein WAK01_19235 [Methylocystis sp.]
MQALIAAATEQDRQAFEGLREKRDYRTTMMRFSASLLLHILVILLLVIEIETQVEIVEAEIIPVEVALVAPPPADPPPPPPEPAPPPPAQEPAPPPPPQGEAPSSKAFSLPKANAKSDAKAASDAQQAHDSKAAGGGGVPEVGDADRSLKAPLGSATVSGEGQTEAKEGAAPAAQQPGEGEPTPPDPDKEISHVVPTAKKAGSSRKPRLALPGPAARAAREKPDPNATDEEATIKSEDIHCGAKAKMPTPKVAERRTAQVLGLLSDDQASSVHARMQLVRDLRVNPRFLHVRAVAVHFDGQPENAWNTTFLPPGLNVKVGDRVETAGGHVDPSSPCTYIPRLVLRVL